MFRMQKKKLSSVCETNCVRLFGFRFGQSLQILLLKGLERMKGEIMFNNAHTIVISHYCIFTTSNSPRLLVAFVFAAVAVFVPPW